MPYVYHPTWRKREPRAPSGFAMVMGCLAWVIILFLLAVIFFTAA